MKKFCSLLIVAFAATMIGCGGNATKKAAVEAPATEVQAEAACTEKCDSCCAEKCDSAACAGCDKAETCGK